MPSIDDEATGMPVKSQPVEVTNDESMPVLVAPARQSDTDTPAQTEARILAAHARVEANTARTDDQRRISGVWEGTQRQIALSVVWAALFVGMVLVLSPVAVLLVTGDVPEWTVTASVAGLLFLTGAANLVIGFYFGRTNHQRVGGDASPSDDAVGR